MKKDEEFDIGELFSDIISSDIFKGLLVLIITVVFTLLNSIKEELYARTIEELYARTIEELYARTLFIPVLLLGTMIRIVIEKPCQILFYILIYSFVHMLATDNFREKYLKIFRMGYIVLCLIIILGQTVRMNAAYKLDKGPVTTAHAMFLQFRDMIENDSVTFYDEPCRVDLDMIEYYTYDGQRRGNVLKRNVAYYPYLCLDNQGDMIPLASGYASVIENILEENGGVCDITCYENSHLIKAINGVELKDLRK